MPLTELSSIAGLAAAATPEAASALRDLAETTADKETRKAARRALYRLKEAGIEPMPAAVSPKSASAVGQTFLRAFASAYDGAGNRIIVPILPDPDHGSPTLLQILVSDDEGIRHMNAVRLGRAALEDRLARYAEQLEAGVAFAELEADYARRLIAEFREINRRLRTAMPAGFIDFLPRIGAPERDWSEPPVYAALPAEAVLADESVPHKAEELFTLPWFRAWLLDEEMLLPTVDRIGELYNSPVEMSDEVRKERIDRIANEAIDLLMGPDLRACYARRLEETADILWRRQQELPARQALYHALQLRSDRAAHEIDFANRLFWRSFATLIHTAKQEMEHGQQSEN